MDLEDLLILSVISKTCRKKVVDYLDHLHDSISEKNKNALLHKEWTDFQKAVCQLVTINLSQEMVTDIKKGDEELLQKLNAYERLSYTSGDKNDFDQ